jgi:hypothetical protein
MLVTHIHHLMTDDGVRDVRRDVERGAEEGSCRPSRPPRPRALRSSPAMRGGQTGSEIQTSMAIVILFGRTSSTMLKYWSLQRYI